MIILLSPSKNLHNLPKQAHRHTLPRLSEEALKLIKTLRKQTTRSLQELMEINEKLAALNIRRYHDFSWPHTPENATAAIYTFRGEVYLGLEAGSLSKSIIDVADKQIRILSGLYGLLRPLDLIQPYRLEMGTELKVGKSENLYSFWGNKITHLLNQDIADTGSKHVVNLASQEYSHAIHPEKLAAPVMDIQFLEDRNGKLQFLSFVAKRSRGVMARFIVENKIRKVSDLRAFDVQGYAYNTELSDDKKMVFVR